MLINPQGLNLNDRGNISTRPNGQLTDSTPRPIVRAMDSNLSLLEQKLDQLISLLEQSHTQNGELRTRLTATEARCRQLESQMDAARGKLEQVVAHLPESMSLS